MRITMAVFKSKLATNQEAVVYDGKVWYMQKPADANVSWFYSDANGTEENKLPWVAGKEDTFEPIDPKSERHMDYIAAHFPGKVEQIQAEVKRLEDENPHKQ